MAERENRMMTEKCCYNCKFFWADYSVNAFDCNKANDMTEEEFEKYFIDDKPGCIYWQEIEYYENFKEGS